MTAAKETELGFEIDTPEAFFFFGKREASLKTLESAYPFDWARVRQTHSDIVLPSREPWSEPLHEADGHWTRRENLALLISTADCVPVLLFHREKKAIAAVHAGWRGVASRIVPKTLEIWDREFGSISSVLAWIGPHIQLASFEVDEDVKTSLLSSVRTPPEKVFETRDGGKSHVDLNSLMRRQLTESGLSEDSLRVLAHDTKTDGRFHSHRRDREKAGRQLSFAVLKKTSL